MGAGPGVMAWLLQPVVSMSSFQARRGGGQGQLPWGEGSRSGPLTGGPVGAQPCVLCHLGMRHC